jgi:uncharacterized membrane protein
VTADLEHVASNEAGGPEPDGATATGLSPSAAAALAYSAWWLTGALFLLVEPHPYVRFHARQAFLGLGLVWVAGVGFWALSLVLVFVSPALFRSAAVLAQLTLAAGVVLWVVCVVQALRGRAWRVPGLGALARGRRR